MTHFVSKYHMKHKVNVKVNTTTRPKSLRLTVMVNIPLNHSQEDIYTAWQFLSIYPLRTFCVVNKIRRIKLSLS